MEEYIKQEEENTKKYRDYIDRRRQEIKTRQSDVLDRLNRNLEDKYSVKKNLQNSDVSEKYPKNFLNEIISRLPPEKPEKEFTDINQILSHLHGKRVNLATK